MWTPIRLTDNETGRSVHVTIFEKEMYLSGEWSFEDLWYMNQPLDGQIELTLDKAVGA